VGFLTSAGHAIRKLIITAIMVFVIGGLVYLFIGNYEFVFSKDITGTVIGIERVTNPNTVVSVNNSNTTPNSIPNEQIFSFAVAVQGADGQILSSSTEDRQWAVVQKGMCVESRFYPYPPWDLSKSGTYHNARLTRIVECNGTTK
jgi:hypothetical protein